MKEDELAAFGLDSSLQGDSDGFECNYVKPDECDPAITPCKKTSERCEEVHGRNPPGMRHSCYVAWMNDTKTGITVKLKGCWLAQDVAPFDCGNKECVADSSTSPTFKDVDGGPAAFYCCCNQPNCNERFEYRPKLTTTTHKPSGTTSPATSGTDVTASLVYAFAPICLLALLIIAIYWIYRRYKLRRAVQRLAQNGVAGLPFKIPPSPIDASKTIELIEVIARGRYGSVFKARLNDQLIAVKVFPPQDVDSWVQEQEIYATPGMRIHPNILKYMGAECRRTNGDQVEYWLITAYQEYGSLHDFLKHHTIDVPQMLHISTTMLSGLAYLHEESTASGDSQSYKPTIVHRDFKSRNVLLKPGLTACIADFGLALKCFQGRSPHDIHALVGTRRYMAPEVLEGATEFSATAFRQIDVYAAALVLWEIMSRCSFNGEPLGEYRLPFDEVGTRPTLEEMQDYVVVKKKRPPIKEIWLQNTLGSAICSTIGDMWDKDPEARLTAGCALQRYSMLESTVKSPSQMSELSPPLHPTPYSFDSGVNMGGMNTVEKLETSPLIVSDTPLFVETKIV